MKIHLKHIVITLFNLKLYRHDKAQQEVCTQEWMDERFRLFERFCLPSMKAQSTRQFVWLCLFDASTSPAHRARIEGYRQEVPQLHPAFLSSEETKEWKQHLATLVAGFVEEGDRYVITTNLDNDDCLHREALERIQQAVCTDRQSGLYVFPCGWQYFVGKRLMLRMRYPHNHFMSLCEECGGEPIRTIKCAMHGGIRKKEKRVTDIGDRPYWIEVVHERNVANCLRVTSRIRYAPLYRQMDWAAYGLDGREEAKLHAPCGMTLSFIALYLATCCRKIAGKISARFGHVA